MNALIQLYNYLKRNLLFVNVSLLGRIVLIDPEKEIVFHKTQFLPIGKSENIHVKIESKLMKVFHYHSVVFVMYQEIDLFHQYMFEQVHKLVYEFVNLVELLKIIH